MDWFQCGSEVHLRAYQGSPVCCVVRVDGGTKRLLLQRHTVSPLEMKGASPLVASLTWVKWLWLAFSRVRNDFRHFKVCGSQIRVCGSHIRLISRRCSAPAAGELECIGLLQPNRWVGSKTIYKAKL